MSPMEQFGPAMQEVIAHKASAPVTPFMSQYTVWLIIAVCVCILVMVLAAKKVSLLPEGRFFSGIEQLTNWFRWDIGYNTIGPEADRHIPFLAALFFFILTSNLIGLIPGVACPTGVIGTTFALALASFIYFNYYGFKTHGFLKYMKSFAPEGVFFPMNIIVWLLELISCFVRLVTLAVRLFANMYAGHLILGAFALLSALFFAPILQGFTGGALLGALPSVLWMALLILMYAMEIMVACIQAYVFTMLSAVYIQLAIATEH